MEAVQPISKQQVVDILDRVKDPEIDTVSVIDLGMVEHVHIQGSEVSIQMLPTFWDARLWKSSKKYDRRSFQAAPSDKCTRRVYI